MWGRKATVFAAKSEFVNRVFDVVVQDDHLFRPFAGADPNRSAVARPPEKHRPREASISKLGSSAVASASTSPHTRGNSSTGTLPKKTIVQCRLYGSTHLTFALLVPLNSATSFSACVRIVVKQSSTRNEGVRKGLLRGRHFKNSTSFCTLPSYGRGLDVLDLLEPFKTKIF